MPLGDGTGPPDGTGPMTGRRRFGDACRALVRKSDGEGTSWAKVFLALAVGVATVALGFLGEWLARREREE